MKRFFLILFFLLIGVYYPVVSAPKTVNPDASIIYSNLESFKSLSDYFIGLIEFRTIDLQPLRDLSLWLDYFFFIKFKVGTAVLQNILWWTITCFFIFRIITKLYPDLKQSTALIIIYGFALYPLFSNTICWGIARKHILAFLFLVITIDHLLRLNKISILNSLKLCLLYALSLLAQPIHLLFPVWAAVFLFIHKKCKNLKELFLFLFPSFILMALACYLNFIYFHKSPAYLSNYAPKTSLLALSLGDVLLSLGHYHFQLFFPYFLSFDYSLASTQVLWGLGIFTALILLAYKKADGKGLVWLLLGYFSLSVILTNPHYLYDTYLLSPALTFLIFFIGMRPAKFPQLKLVMCSLIIFWALGNFYESQKWINPLSFTEVSFRRNPNCSNAMSFQIFSYIYNQRVSTELKEYVVNNQCLRIQSEQLKRTATPNMNLREKLLRIESFVYLFEKDLDLNQRVEGLKRLSRLRFTFLSSLAVLYVNEGLHTEADKVIKDIIQKGKHLRSGDNDAIIEKYLHPYCIKKEWKECTDITSLFIGKEFIYY